MKRAAIIGARSMLGRQLAFQLQERGIEVIVVGRDDGDDVFLDLGTGLRTDTVTTCADVIFHCAASFADDSPAGAKINFQVNVSGSFLVGELARLVGAETVIYAGSASSLEALDPGNYGSYGLSKALAEQWLAWEMERHGGRFCSLRFSQLYDTEGRCCHRQPWFGRVVAYAAHGMDINMPRSNGVRNFIHVDDAARLMIGAAEKSVSGILDIVHAESVTYDELAAMAYAFFGKGGKAVIAEDKTPFRRIEFPNGELAHAALTDGPAITMAEGIRRIRDGGTWVAFGPMDVE